MKPDEKKQPDSVELEEIDLLKIENAHLKFTRAAEAANRAKEVQDAVAAAISKKLGIDSIQNYSIDTRSMTATRMKGGDNAKA